MKIKNKTTLIALFFILAISAFFRLWNLKSIPPGLYPDEAVNANQAIIEPAKVFYPENNGREGLFVILLKMSFKAFGTSIFALRVLPALIGILTVLGLYLFSSRLFHILKSYSNLKLNPQAIGLMSSLFLGLSFWHTNFSRIAFRAILTPFCLVFSFYFLLKAFELKKYLYFIIAGIFFGLGFYTYIAFRLAVLILIPILFGWYLIYKQKKETKKFIIYGSCFLLTTFIVALPIGIYFLSNPSDFLSRSSSISVFGQESPIKSLAESLIRHLLMFNVYGDANWRHNISKSPILCWPVGTLFLVGLFLSIQKTINLIKSKNYGLMMTTYGLLLSWWVVMLLPGVLTAEGIPHSLRVIGSIPPTFIFAGLGFIFMYQYAEKWTKKHISLKKNYNYYLLVLSLCILFISFVFAQYSRYFEIWGKNEHVLGAFSNNYVTIGLYLNLVPDNIYKYVIVNQSGTSVEGKPISAQTPMFVERAVFNKTRAIYLTPESLDEIKTDKESITMLMEYDRGLLVNLSKKFPSGKVNKIGKIWTFSIQPEKTETQNTQ